MKFLYLGAISIILSAKQRIVTKNREITLFIWRRR
jgi:hypothetical protein